MTVIKKSLGHRPRLTILTLVFLLFVVSAVLLAVTQYSTMVRAAHVFESYGIGGIYSLEKSRVLPDNAHVEWLSTPPESQGIQSTDLQEVTEGLAEKNTTAFLVVKDGQLLHEWYDESHDLDQRVSTAALAKAVTGSVVLMAAMDTGSIRLEDPAWKYIPEWADDPQKSQITIGDLGSHRSGLDDVLFGDNLPPGWKQTYYDNPDLRFSMARSDTPVIFEPGTRTLYSGVAYYALAYAVARSLHDSPNADLQELLNTRVMEPLDIPRGAWTMSYGERYQIDGMRVYAIGSGGGYTPRAIARIGELFLNKGEWNGHQIIKAESVDAVLGYRDPRESPPVESFGIGWRSNSSKTSASLPADAFWGSGGDDQLLLVIPSLDLVIVRMGGPLSPELNASLTHSLAPSGTFSEENMEEFVFKPLMEAVR